MKTIFLSRLKPLLTCIILLHALTGNTQQNNLPINEEIESYFTDWNHPDKPGAAIAVVHNGKVAYTKGFGSADLEHQTPVTTTTKFQLQSLDNQVVAFAVLLLESEGKLSLDDDLRKYIPEMPKLGKPIAIRNLLTHTHGLPDFMGLHLVAGWTMEDQKTRSEALDLLFRLKEKVAEPGEQVDYCITGFLLASEIVARVSKMSYPEFAKTRIFQAIGMMNTVYHGKAGTLVSNRARPYSPEKEGFKNETLSYYCLTDFTLYSTVEDLAKWMLHLESPKVGSLDIIKKINTPITLNNGTVADAAPGQFVSTYKGLNKLEHSGMAYGNLAYIARFPDQNFGLVVLGNAYNFNAQEAALKTADLYLKGFYKEEDNPPTTTQNTIDRKTIKLDVADLKKFCGAYWNTQSFYSRKIILKEDKLFYHRSEGNESELTPINKNTFVLTQDPDSYSIRFEHKKDKPMMIFSVGTEYEYEHEKYQPVSYSPTQLKEFTGTFFCENMSTIYQLEMKNEKLIATHLRKEDIVMSPYKTDKFTSPAWYFSNLEFVRDTKGNVSGFQLNTANLGNHFFRKFDTLTNHME